MIIQYINTGTSANKGDGDSLRTAFNKINQNFSVLSTATTLTRIDIVPTSSTSTGVINQVAFTGTDMYICTEPNVWVKFSGAAF